MAKRAGSLYRAGRSSDWRKLKCECRQEMVIGGFTEPQGSRDSFGALLLGYWEGDDLVYAGKVGTGFTRATLHELYEALSERERSSSPFVAGAVERGARWVEPSLVAEVIFSNWTRDGRLRHPSFVRLRPDKASHEVGGEECRVADRAAPHLNRYTGCYPRWTVDNVGVLTAAPGPSGTVQTKEEEHTVEHECKGAGHPAGGDGR